MTDNYMTDNCRKGGKVSKKFLLALGLALGFGLGLSACEHYDLKVNERVVYTPRPLFSDFAAPDPALQACLEKAIASLKVTSATQLQELDCSGAGVKELTGLSVFTGLQRLHLADNQIESLAALAPLSSLDTLDLRGNGISDPLPLYDMLSLRNLDLRGNKALRCPRPQDLLRVVDLNLPGHCAKR